MSNDYPYGDFIGDWLLARRVLPTGSVKLSIKLPILYFLIHVEVPLHPNSANDARGGPPMRLGWAIFPNPNFHGVALNIKLSEVDGKRGFQLYLQNKLGTSSLCPSPRGSVFYDTVFWAASRGTEDTSSRGMERGFPAGPACQLTRSTTPFHGVHLGPVGRGCQQVSGVIQSGDGWEWSSDSVELTWSKEISFCLLLAGFQFSTEQVRNRESGTISRH